MIEIRGLKKSFDGAAALDGLSLDIPEGQVTGVVGVNGAGKSTLLRLMAGILKADSGSVSIDGREVYESPETKAELFFVSDDQYYFASAAPADLLSFYAMIYRDFDRELCSRLMESFGLPTGRKIAAYSKGMKKLLSMAMALSAGTRYVLLDETFDGLDPVMRKAVRELMRAETVRRSLTPVITSHNLRELEDICDRICLIYSGEILFESALSDMRTGVCKLQYVLPVEASGSGTSDGTAARGDVPQGLSIITREDRGRLISLTLRASEEEAVNACSHLDPLYMEVIPLSLEEVFICETEAVGYDAGKIIL